MAQYKVIQDIEAEDKLVANLTLRQFIYFGAAMLMVYISYVCFAAGAGFMIAVFILPIIFCLFFAFPWGKDQSTEVWALSQIRFFLKPRKRIWDQSGQKELVTITAPKKVEKHYTNGLSQEEVKSRLSALADTIDSRGWSVKNSNVTMPSLPTFNPAESDRLVQTDPTSAPLAGSFDVKPSDDMLDADNSPLARQVDSLIRQADQAHHQRIIDQMNAPAGTPAAASLPQPTAPQVQPDYWFLNQPSNPAVPTDPNNVMFATPTTVTPGQTPASQEPSGVDEAALTQQLKQNRPKRQAPNLHLKTIQPPGQEPAPKPAPAPQPTASNRADIMNLARNNDFDVATIARQFNKAQQGDDGEVVIPLR